MASSQVFIPLVDRLANELKCPICLNLLNKAVSLNCNHSFCHECIYMSMKSASLCPVCKLPFTRREIHPAPTLDSVVTICRDMKDAVGMSSCSTQAPSADLEDSSKENMEPNVRNSKRKAEENICTRAKRARNCKDEDAHVENEEKIPSPHQPVKQSFPAKKRVHASLKPPGNDQETPPLRPCQNATIDNKNGSKSNNEKAALQSVQGDYIIDLNTTKALDLSPDPRATFASVDKVLVDESGNPILEPFFWLRENDSQDEEGVHFAPSQPTQLTPNKNESLSQVSFSDLKDSDDEGSFRQTQSGRRNIGMMVPDTLDGDTLDWIQVPCSQERTPSSKKTCPVVSEEDVQKSMMQEGARASNSEYALSETKDVDTQKNDSLKTENQINDSESPVEKIPTNENHQVDEDTPVKAREKHCSSSTQFESPFFDKNDALCNISKEANAQLPSQPNLVNVTGIQSQNEVSPQAVCKNAYQCAFCHEDGNSTTAGEMVHYWKGKPVQAEGAHKDTVHVHKACAEWAPNVYFEGEKAINLEAEILRGSKIKCSICGLKGAALGCFMHKCHKSFHVSCAINEECRWDINDFLLLCPAHSKRKFPSEKNPFNKSSSKPRNPTHTVKKDTSPRETKSEIQWSGSSETCKWVLCGSALDSSHKQQLNEFAKLTGMTISSTWNSSVTHVIASVDGNGACRRTLKFLMAILQGKWILSPDWITACSKAKAPVKETTYEITHDIHGTFGGPQRGRARVENKEPKLFEEFSFYFCGEFSTSSKKYLQDLATAAGGLVLQRKPISNHLDGQGTTVVIFNIDLPEATNYSEEEKKGMVENRSREARSVAEYAGAKYAAHTWLLDSIAACRLSPDLYVIPK